MKLEFGMVASALVPLQKVAAYRGDVKRKMSYISACVMHLTAVRLWCVWHAGADLPRHMQGAAQSAPMHGSNANTGATLAPPVIMAAQSRSW